jgi:hypothetical protein
MIGCSPQEANRFPASGDPFCQEKLNQEIKKLLETDSDLITDLYQLSNLKLANRLNTEPQLTNNLEDYISKKLANLDSSRKEELVNKINQLYNDHGMASNYETAKIILEDIEQAKYSDPSRRLRGIKASIAINLLRNMEDKCSGIACLNETDEALTWFVGKVREANDHLSDGQRNMMDTPTILAHYSGYVNPKLRLDSAQSAQALAEVDSKIKATLKDFEDAFFAKYQNCIDSFGSRQCFQQEVNKSLAQQIKGLIKTFGGEQSAKVSIGSRDITLGSIKLHYGLSNAYVSQVSEYNRKKKEEADKRAMDFQLLRTDEESDAPQDPYTCGGKPFKGGLSKKRIVGVLNPKSAYGDAKSGLKAGKDAWKIYKKGGLKAIGKMAKEGSKAVAGNHGKGIGGKILNFLKIPGPFRCSTDSPIPFPKFGMLTADKKVCCNDEEKIGALKYYFITLYNSGLTCRVFFGIPYVAEVGAKVGLGLSLFGSGGTEPAECGDMTCFGLTPTFNVSLSVYGELLSGLATLQGGISWIPYASFKQCIYSDPRPTPPLAITYKVGRILFIGTARVGWAFTFHTVKPIYESHNENKTTIAIF